MKSLLVVCTSGAARIKEMLLQCIMGYSCIFIIVPSVSVSVVKALPVAV